jgi:hypothetical protein
MNIIEDLLLLAVSTYIDSTRYKDTGYKYNRGPAITGSKYL